MSKSPTQHAWPQPEWVRPGLLRDVGERAVAVVVKQVTGRLAVPHFRIEAASVHQKDVEPAVVVVVEEGGAAAHFLEQELLVQRAAGHVLACSRPAAAVTSVNTTGPGDCADISRETAKRRRQEGRRRAPEDAQELTAWMAAAVPAIHARAPGDEAFPRMPAPLRRFFSSSLLSCSRRLNISSAFRLSSVLPRRR